MFRHIDIAKDVLTFAGGTVTVRDGVFAGPSSTRPAASGLSPKRAVWKIAKGTGAYATAKGHGHYKATGTIQGTHTDSGCDFTTPTGTIVVTATGKVRL